MPSILITTVASSASALGPSPAKAITGVEAVHFDGSTYLETANFPTISPDRYGLLSFWFNVSSVGGYYTILEIGGPVYNAVNIFLSPDIFVTTLQDNSTNLMWRECDILASYDGNWHHVLLSWDTQNSACLAYLDDSAISMADPDNHSTGVVNAVGYGSAFVARVGGAIFGNNKYTGDLAEVFFLAGTYVDITDPNVRLGFRRPSGEPVRNGMNGTTALGDQPQIFLFGNSSTFTNNYKDGEWDLLGNYLDEEGPNEFEVSVGTLTTALTDPWGGEASGF